MIWSFIKGSWFKVGTATLWLIAAITGIQYVRRAEKDRFENKVLEDRIEVLKRRDEVEEYVNDLSDDAVLDELRKHKWTRNE